MASTVHGWKYRARTHDGQIREGVVQALTAEDASRALVRSKLIPESVKPAPRGRSFRLRRRSKPRSMALFARQFSTLVDAAVPLIQSLETLRDLTDDKVLRKALDQVIVDVQSGQSLGDAMRHHPGVFTDIFVNMVEAGEHGGVLDIVLQRLADYLEKSQELVSKVKTALVYPMVILVAAVLCSAVMLIFVVPTFEEMFSAGGLTLPLPTQILMRTSEFVQSNWLGLLVGTVMGVLFLRHVYGTRAGRRFFDRMFIRVPVLGDLIRKTAVARFAQSMASLLNAGVHLIDAIETSARTANNAVIERGIMSSCQAIEAGQGIAEPLAESGVVPSLVTRMVEVGEQTGSLDKMFDKVATFYEAEVDTAVQRLMKAAEPALIVVVGGILGTMVVALYLPIFEALTSVGN